MTRNLVAALVLSVLSLGLSACSGVGAGNSALTGPPRVTLDSDEAKQKLGDDDGLEAAIFYGAELNGSIDDCGCPGHPQGGLPWRYGYTEGFRARYPEVAALQVDAGNSMTDLVNAEGQLYPDSVAKNEWVLKAFDELGFDAVNLSHKEAYYVARFLESAEAWEKAKADRPVLARFVSANLEPARPGMIAPAPYVVREMNGKRLGETVKVAFVGITENNPVLPTHTGLRVVDAADALAKVLPKAKAEADVVVVMAYMAQDAVAQLASTVGDQVDAFIVSHPRGRDAEPSLDAKPRVTYARYQTRQLGEMRLFLNGKSIEKVVNRYVTLDDQLPKDPIAAEMAVEAKEAIKKAQMDRFNNFQPNAAPAQSSAQGK